MKNSINEILNRNTIIITKGYVFLNYNQLFFSLPSFGLSPKMFHSNSGMNTTTDIKITHDFHFFWFTSRNQIIQDNIYHFFVKSTFIAVRGEVNFQ